MGIPRIFSIFEHQNFLEPTLSESVDPVDATTLVLPFLRKQKWRSDMEGAILTLLQDGGEWDSATLSSKLGLSRTLVNKALSKLLRQGVLESNGLRTNGRKYRLRLPADLNRLGQSPSHIPNRKRHGSVPFR